ncbi:MAG: hypothetical protein JWO03_891 [Bacteroidetes bacterium]|nr:hypothetical protein [Bacteroidota bacterium]
MRKIMYIIVLCLSTQVLMAVESKPTAIKAKKLFVGVHFSPGVAFRTLRLVKHSNGYPEAYELYKKYDKPIFGYDLGVNLEYLVNPYIGLQTGANYSLKGLEYEAPFSFSSGIATMRYQVHYVDIPLKMKVYAGKGRVKFVGGAGIIFNVAFGQTNKSKTVENGKITYQSSHSYFPLPKGPEVFSMSATASAGIDYKINELMGIRIEPAFSHQFIPFAKGGIYTYLWAAGINVAYYFGVK